MLPMLLSTQNYWIKTYMIFYIMNMLMVLLSIVLNGLNTEMSNGWIKLVAFSIININMTQIWIDLSKHIVIVVRSVSIINQHQWYFLNIRERTLKVFQPL